MSPNRTTGITISKEMVIGFTKKTIKLIFGINTYQRWLTMMIMIIVIIAGSDSDSNNNENSNNDNW